MAERSAAVPYNPAPTVDATGGGGTPMGVRATPDDFGGQIGGALQQAGKTGEQLGNQATDIALQQQGMINETMATNAETQYMTKLGELTGKYKSLEGLAAVSARPQYVQDVSDLRNTIAQNLPMGANRAFSLLALRHEGYAIGDANSYAAQQIKEADKKSAAALTTNAVVRSGDLSVAQDDNRFDGVLGDISFSAVRQISAAGWNSGTGMSQDPKTGKVSFDDSPQGKQAQAVYQSSMDTAVGSAWENRLHVLADQNVMGAYQKYQDNRSRIPGEAQVKLDGFFTPKIRDYQARSGADDAMATADQAFKTLSLSSINGPKPGTSEDSAINWTMQHEGGFVTNDSGKGPTNFGINQEANKDIDVTKLSQDQAKALMKSRYFDQVITPNMSPQMQIVAGDSAVNMGVTKTKELLAQAGDDPQKMIDLRRQEYQRLATDKPEKYGQYLSSWNNRLDDLQKTIAAGGVAANQNSTIQPPRDFAAMPVTPIQAQASGITSQPSTPQVPITPPMSQADYYRTNYQNIIDHARGLAQQQHPDDPSFADTVEARVKSRMGTVIQAQELKYKADNDTVYKAIDGGYTNGTKPTTIEQLVASSPDVKAAWQSVSINNPQAANLIETRLLTSNPMAKDEREYGPGYPKLVDGIKNGSVTQDDLLKHLNVDIGRSGFDALQKLTQGTDEEKQYKTANLQALKRMLSGEDSVAGIKDNKGEALYAQALPLFDKEVTRLKGEGVPLTEIYNPQSKNWAGNAVRSLVRTPEQQFADIAAATTSGETASNATPSSTSPQRNLSSIIQDVRSGKMTSEAGESEALKLGFIRPRSGPQVPLAGGQ